MKNSLIRFSVPVLLSIVFLSGLRGQGVSLPEGAQIVGPAKESPGWLTAAEDGRVTISGEIPEQTPVLVLKGRVGKTQKEQPSWRGVWLGVNGAMIALNTQDITAKTLPVHGGADAYPDAVLGVICRTGGKALIDGKMVANASLWTRPNPTFYKEAEWLAEQKEAWEKQPSASEHEFTLEVRSGKEEMEVWLDGLFVGRFPPENVGEIGSGYALTLMPGAAIHSLQLEPMPTALVSLDVALNPRVTGEATVPRPAEDTSRFVAARVPVERMSNAKLAITPGAKVPGKFQALDGTGTAGIAMGGLGTVPGIKRGYLSSAFFLRSVWDNLSEQRMFTVPRAAYAWADILCAADDDPNHASEFTLRVTRYGSPTSRGDAIADTLVKVPAADAKDTPDARRVGTVTYGPEGTRKTTALWLIRVPIHSGQIQDLIEPSPFNNRELPDYLDVELLDPLANAEETEAFPPPLIRPERAWEPSAKISQGDNFTYTNPSLFPTPVSGVTVFGLIMVKSPAALVVEAKPGGKVFYASEKPELLAKVRAVEAGEYTVHWQFADVDGKKVDSGKQSLQLAAGAEKTVSLPVKQENGWYAAHFALSDPDGNELATVISTFVMLPPDTRKAGIESPYDGNWFPANDGDPKLEVIGPLFQRAGIRRVDRGGGGEPFPEASTLAAYGFTRPTILWGESGKPSIGRFTEGEITLAEAMAEVEDRIRKELESAPSIDRLLIFHESTPMGAPFPSELWGEPATSTGSNPYAVTPETLLAEANGVPVAEKKERELYWKHWPKRMEFITGMAKMVREKFPKLKMQYGNDGNSLNLVGEIFRQKFPRKWIDSVAEEDLGQRLLPERLEIGGLQDAWLLREMARKMGYGDVPVTACTEWIARTTLALGNRNQAEWKARDGLLALAYGFDTIPIAFLNDHGTAYYFSGWGNGGMITRYPELNPKPAYAAVATLTRVLDSAKYRRFLDTGSTVLYAEEFQRGDEWIYVLWTPRGEREATLEFPSEDPRALTDLYGREKVLKGKSLNLRIDTAPQYLVSKQQLLSVTPGTSIFTKDRAPEKPEKVIPLESLEDLVVASGTATFKLPWSYIPLPMRKGKFEIRQVEDPEMGKCLEIELTPEGDLPSPLLYEYALLTLPHPVTTRAKNLGIWIKGNGSWGVVIPQVKGTPPWTNWDMNFAWESNATLNFDGWNFISYPYYNWTRKEDYTLNGIVLSIPRSALVGTEMVPVKSLKVRLKSIVLY